MISDLSESLVKYKVKFTFRWSSAMESNMTWLCGVKLEIVYYFGLEIVSDGHVVEITFLDLTCFREISSWCSNCWSSLRFKESSCSPIRCLWGRGSVNQWLLGQRVCQMVGNSESSAYPSWLITFDFYLNFQPWPWVCYILDTNWSALANY